MIPISQFIKTDKQKNNMSKKIIIISTIVLVIFFISLAGYYFLIQTNENASNGETFSFRRFLPFGGETIIPEPTEIDPNIPIEEPQINFAVKLRKIWSEPVAGAFVYDTQEGSIVRLVERSTGHVYDVDLFSPNNKRISNTTIPKVYDAKWINKDSFVAQFLEDDNETIRTYIIEVNEPLGTTTEGTSLGKIINENINSLSVSQNRFFYLALTGSIGEGFIGNQTNTSIRKVWSSPIKELNLQDLGGNNVALFTKPYPNVNGFLYLVNTTNGVFRRVLANIPGLTVLVSPNTSKVLTLSQSNSNRFYIYNVSNVEEIDINPITFPEKCIWSNEEDSFFCAVPKNQLQPSSLISWYLGNVSFEDSIWKYNSETGFGSSVDSLDKEGIDVIKPILNPSERYLIFTNKKDGSLWSLDLQN